MEVTVNGVEKRLDAGASVADLIQILSLEGRRIAVELNMEIVSRSEHSSTLLNEGDRLEIVHAIGGG